MPVRRRGTLLAGMAALLGLSTAGAGCQSSNVCNPCCVATPGGAVVSSACSAPGVTMMRPVAQAGTRRSIFGRRKTTQEPMLAQAAPAATMMRPVAGQPAGVEASAWAPVQRVGGDPGAGGIGQVVTMERPQAAGYAPVVRTEGDPAIVPIPAGAAPPVVDDGKRGTTLPHPRAVPNGHGVRHPAGYPELPALVVPQAPDVPKEFNKRALSNYVIEPPDFLLIEAKPGALDPADKGITARFTVLVQPDGFIRISTLGPIFAAGKTVDQLRRDIAVQIIRETRKIEPDKKEVEIEQEIDKMMRLIRVEVSEYNSKFYYVITDGGGYGAQVFRLPYTGNETVLDAFSLVQGLPAVASKKKIWVARATPDHSDNPYILPVDWCGIVQRGSAATNYQLYPGDRIFVQSDAFIRADSALGKFLAPIERLLGTTLLGTSVVNSIANRGGAAQGNVGGIR